MSEHIKEAKEFRKQDRKLHKEISELRKTKAHEDALDAQASRSGNRRPYNWYMNSQLAKLPELQTEQDANSWRAQQHKEEHLAEYIINAAQEDEAKGVQINLEPPKA